MSLEERRRKRGGIIRQTASKKQNNSSQVGILVITTLEMKEPRLREVKERDRYHTAVSDRATA